MIEWEKAAFHYFIDLQSHCCAPACTVECPGWRAPIPSLYAAPRVISDVQGLLRHSQQDCAWIQVKSLKLFSLISYLCSAECALDLAFLDVEYSLDLEQQIWFMISILPGWIKNTPWIFMVTY